jgi:hypothetical protein
VDEAQTASQPVEAGTPTFGQSSEISNETAKKRDTDGFSSSTSVEAILPAVQGPKEVSLIAAGHSLTVLCSANGETYVCGGGKDGVLGLGEESDIFHVEQLVPVPSLQVVICRMIISF